jgi:hypothetical protein
MHRYVFISLRQLALVALLAASVVAQETKQPPKGFRALFNGKDLSGWRVYIMGGNQKKVLSAEPKDVAAARKKVAAERDKFWTVKDGAIVNPKGKGPYLETTETFGDFELLLDWWIAPKADSGIYLRGVPQVQMWDPVAGIPQAKVGSGGLYNNKKGPSKPLVRADKPAGEWNTFRITLVGDVCSIWLNGALVVDETPLENYWDRGRSLYPTGPIQFQTHGGELRFRNIFLRELDQPNESGVLSLAQTPVGPGWKRLFNGNKLEGFQAEPAHWNLEEGVLTGKVAGSPKHHYAYTDAEYGDFELHAKVKLSGKNANSGVCIRTKPTSFDDVPGYQVDMGNGFWGCLWDERRDGMVGKYSPAAAKKLVKTDDWNHYYVIARGDHIRGWLNGVQTFNVVHPRGIPKGAIGFQLCHGKNREMTAQFKDVWVREIPDDFHLEHVAPGAEDGFVDLFNGKDLSGWIGRVKGYGVEDGSIFCKRRGGGNLYTARKYANFVFRFEFKLPPGANNGVGVRARYEPEIDPNKYFDAAYHGMEIQVLENSAKGYAKLADYQYHGSVYGLVPATRGYQKAPRTWNYQEITADGNHIVVKLNGKTIIDADLKKDTPKNKWRGHPGMFNKDGYLGFLGHGARVEFRNIRLKELK